MYQIEPWLLENIPIGIAGSCHWLDRSASWESGASHKCLAWVIAVSCGSQYHRFAAFRAGLIIFPFFTVDNRFNISDMTNMGFERRL